MEMQKVEKIRNGKIRDVYDVGENLLVVFLDRVSTLNFVFPETIPKKGIVSNKLTAFWYNYTKDIIPNYMISIAQSEMPKQFQTEEYKGRCMLVKKNVKPLPVGGVVRGYATGYSWEKYKKTRYVSEIQRPNLKESEKFSEPVYMPTTRIAECRDNHITYDQSIERIGENLAKKIKVFSLELYEKCYKYAITKGIIIADTKFKFGIDEKGKLMLIEGLITPDNSRFWLESEYKAGKVQKASLDKQNLLDVIKKCGWKPHAPTPTLSPELINMTSKNYVKVFERLTGTKLL